MPRFIAVIVLLCSIPLLSFAQSPEGTSYQQQVESGLLPGAVFDGKVEPWRIEHRMVRWKVPAVSVAVIDDGKIVWAQGYGVLRAGQDDPVTMQTRFQAASISKTVTAAAALSLVDARQLTLDGDIAAALRSWSIPAKAFTAQRALTLRDLLSHTGGVTVSGFSGYAQGAPVPTLVQVLNGEAPANSDPVVVGRKPGEARKYSGGGYEIVQMAIDDVTGRSFADIVSERVLKPADMSSSGYELPAVGTFALGHGRDGRPIAGGWHTYPERAAAGLWTTPTDLARLAVALSTSFKGQPGGLLEAGTARTMMTPLMDGYGLGVEVRADGERLAVSHSGTNEGFRATWVIHPVTGDGVVVMTNGAAGGGLTNEIIRAVARVYGWPDYAPAQHQSVSLHPDVLTKRVGMWSGEQEGERTTVTVRLANGGLAIENTQGTFHFVPVNTSTMRARETNATATFEPGPDGGTVLKIWGLELKRNQ